MDGYLRDEDRPLPKGPSTWEAGAWLLGALALFLAAIVLEAAFGVPGATTLRVACVGICQFFVYQLGKEYSSDRWPWIAFWAALFVNAGILLSPLVDRPMSRGELMLFAPPDTVVVLLARIVSYRVGDVHQRAMRQQMILGLIVAAALCAALWAACLTDPRTGHSWGSSLRLHSARNESSG